MNMQALKFVSQRCQQAAGAHQHIPGRLLGDVTLATHGDRMRWYDRCLGVVTGMLCSLVISDRRHISCRSYIQQLQAWLSCVHGDISQHAF